VADGSDERRVFELFPGRRAAQQQAAAAHVAAPDEGRRKDEALAEDLQQRLDVARAGDAAEEHDARLRSGERRQRFGVAQLRLQEAPLAGLDRDAAVLLQARQGDRLGRIAQPFSRRDDEGAAQAGGGPREGARVGELAAEIQ